MAAWGWIAGGYGVLMATAAIGIRTLSNRRTAFIASAAYTVVAIVGARVDVFGVQLALPGAMLLAGYWLSGLFFRDPQPWLERWLLDTDRRVFTFFRAEPLLRASPRWLLEVLEASYAAAYVAVAAGAVLSATAGIGAVERYWAIMLAAELACYGALPWLRSRPPRSLEPPCAIEQRAPRLRSFNLALLDRASVQADTFPSGHVSGAVGAAYAVWSVNPIAGGVFMALAAMIAVSASVGRYHFVLDSVLGGIVGGAAALLVGVAVLP